MKVNRQTKNSRTFVQHKSVVDRSAVRRESINGVEHIIVSSKTMPDDIVMNGVMYPAEAIASSFHTLERTLAPLEHPQDENGEYITATDPFAIHNYYAGAFNANVRRENGRVLIDKVINVPEALKTERGRRLLDRVKELEESNDPRPIHTSTGVFLEVETLDKPKTNAAGQEYRQVARNLVFDHDAILLDSVGAAQPHQGVGMAVNALDALMQDAFGEVINVLKQNNDDTDCRVIEACMNRVRANAASYNERHQAVFEALQQPPFSIDWIVELFEDTVIYELRDVLFRVPYVIDEASGKAEIMGVPVPVELKKEYQVKTNNRGDDMRELMIKALADAKITVNEDISDEELLSKYNELKVSSSAPPTTNDDDASGENLTPLETKLNKLLDAVNTKLTTIETKLAANDASEIEKLTTVIVNSGKYAGLDADALKKLDVETLKTMATNCTPSYGLPLTVVNGGKEGAPKRFEMPA